MEQKHTEPPIDEALGMDRKQLAKRLKVNIQHVAEMLKKDPTMPRPIRRGKSDYWNPADVDAWLKAQLLAVHEDNKRRLAMIEAPAGRKARK